MHTIRQRTKAQALVEFALAATLIFFLLSAAIDLGLIFFRHQGLYNASLEGASYGSRWVKTYGYADLSAMGYNTRARLGCGLADPLPATAQAICVDEAEVRKRVINEAGASGGINVVNLKDLNSDGIPDSNAVQAAYITVQAVGDESNPASACTDLTDPPNHNPSCYLYVKVKSDYHMFFILAPAFGDQVTVSAYTLFPIRVNVPADTNAPPGVLATPTASPTSTNTATASATSTNTTGPTATASNTATNTSTPINTPTITKTPSATSTASQTRTPTVTRTATSTNTPGPSPTRTTTPTRTITNTPAPTNTATRTGTVTNTPLPPTKTNTSAPPTVTKTPAPATNTRTPMPVPPTATTEGT